MYTFSLFNKILLQTYVHFILRCQLGIVDLKKNASSPLVHSGITKCFFIKLINQVD